MSSPERLASPLNGLPRPPRPSPGATRAHGHPTCLALVVAEYTRLREQRDRSYLGRKGQEGGALLC